MHLCLVLTVEGDDYNLANSVLTFPNTSVVGVTACAMFTIINDSILELDEEFCVQITSPSDPPGVTINVPSSTTIVTIEDNEGKSSAVMSEVWALNRCLALFFPHTLTDSHCLL